MRPTALLLLLVCACGRAPAGTAPGRTEGRLAGALRVIGRSPACARAIPTAWSVSLPVPDEKGAGFKAFFFLAERGGDGRFVVSAPAGEVAFDLGGRVAYCRRLPAPARGLGPAAGSALAAASLAEIDGRRGDLLAALENASPAYARRGRLGSRARGILSAYRDLQEPPLSGDYRRLNPDFWGWLEKEAAPPSRDSR